MNTNRGQALIGKELGSSLLEKLLGYGGSSMVFLGRSLSLHKQVAVKVFLRRSTLDSQMRKSFSQRFRREAVVASQLDHPNILSIYDYGEDEGMSYIVMPYMAGGTLAEYVRQHGPLPLKEAQHYLQQIAEALDYTHEHHYVHCDVRPANILLDGSGHAVLSNFGIARVLQTEEADAPFNQPTGKSSEVLMGALDYISPEQLLGEQLDGRTDIYSLGATLYYLLTGNPPFQADSPRALALMHLHETPTPLGLRADVTPQVDFVLSKAMAKQPNERFQTAGRFSEAFLQAISETYEATGTGFKQGRRHLLFDLDDLDEDRWTILNTWQKISSHRTKVEVHHQRLSVLRRARETFAKFFFSRTEKKRRDTELSLFAIARTTLEQSDQAIIGKVYRVEAGISQHGQEDAHSVRFEISVQDPLQAVSFHILFHPSENIELLDATYQSLLYNPDNVEPQFISCSFRLNAPGQSHLLINFYRERQWLKTIRFIFDGIEQSSPSTPGRR